MTRALIILVLGNLVLMLLNFHIHTSVACVHKVPSKSTSPIEDIHFNCMCTLNESIH